MYLLALSNLGVIKGRRIIPMNDTNQPLSEQSEVQYSV